MLPSYLGCDRAVCRLLHHRAVCTSHIKSTGWDSNPRSRPSPELTQVIGLLHWPLCYPWVNARRGASRTHADYFSPPPYQDGAFTVQPHAEKWRRRDSNSHLLGADQPCYRSHYAPEKPPLRIERRSENYEFSVLPLNYGGENCPPRDSNTHPRGRNSRFCPIELGGRR